MNEIEISEEEIARIREKLGWSRPTLARRMGGSESMVRAWESGQNPCRGPAALLLRVLERDPLATARVLESDHDLPSARAEPGTEEWFRLQRLLWLMLRVGGETASFWGALVAAEHLHRSWLDELEDALLIGPAKARYSGLPDAKHPNLRVTSEAGEIAFHLHVFEPWLRGVWEVDGPPISDLVSGTTSDPSLIANVPVMTAEALEEGLTEQPTRPVRVWVP